MKSYSILFLFIFTLFVSCEKAAQTNDILFYRTIIVYMAADNDLSGDAWDNIKEMQRGYEKISTNLIVFIDPANDYPHILQIENGCNKRVKTYAEFDSADATQMEQVLNDIIKMYPAASYGLILWSHGTSWLPASSQLKSFGEDNGRRMDIRTLTAALPVKFNFILFDACLMGAVEVAYELRDKTDFIIASPTDIIFMGFPYAQILPELIRTEPNLSKVASDYFNFYNKMPGTLRSASISLINTKELEQLASITKQFFTSDTFDSKILNRASIQRLDVYSEQYTFDFLDFLEKTFPNMNTTPLKEQLCKTVLYKAYTPNFINEYNIHAFCGLSCYIPHPQRDDLNAFYQHLDWCKDSGFYQLFKEYAY